MDAKVKEQLVSAGINVDSALERFMGNEALLMRFLKKFLDDPNYEKLCAAVDSGDQEAALTASHTLKGVCGNLSMEGLFDLLTCQVRAFREGAWEEAVGMMPEIRQRYSQVAELIRKVV